MRPNRHLVLLGAVVALALGCASGRSRVREVPPPAPELLSAEDRAADFDQLWRFVADHYAYFDDKACDWDAVRARHRPLAIAAEKRNAFIRALEDTLDELYDPHTHLSVNLADSWRLPPHDVWAEWKDGAAIITDVRIGSAAASAGIAPGDEVRTLDAVPIRAAVEARLPQCLRRRDPAARRWALLSVLAGRRLPRTLGLRSRDGAERTVRLEDQPGDSGPGPVVEDHILPSGFGYIRIASFADEAVIAAFDAALDRCKGTPGLVIDVRENAGGDTDVAVPIMGRFVSERLQYAWMARRQGAALGERWPEFVEPRGPWRYEGALVIAVDRWSASMAEGFAMGLDGMRRAVVVGRRMSELGAGVVRDSLQRSGIGYQVSGEPVYHVDGRHRSDFAPALDVDLTGARPSGDRILQAAIAELQQMTAHKP